MSSPGIPITDDHIHIDPVNGRGLEAAKDFLRAGGTHLFLVTKPSWSYGIEPKAGADFTVVFDKTLDTARAIRQLGIGVYVLLGVHPAEITRLNERMPLWEAVEIMKAALDIACEYVNENLAVGLKSGRPHYPVDENIWASSNDVLRHALALGAESGCAVQLHAESGPCTDIVEMAKKVHLDPIRAVKHFATPDTPLTASMIAKHDAIPQMAKEGRLFTMESDFMDENSRPGAVLGPKSVPRFTKKLVNSQAISEEDVYRIHTEAPSRIYGVEID
jgi:TatD-related deoxyribonuclease